jgi:uncharacterized SAM-binding protein YcdF (DUF218 family)
MLHLVRKIAGLFAVLTVLILLVYSPLYSQFIIRTLNALVPVEVNPVAANSQKRAALTPSEQLEPGSELWIARQAYLSLLKQYLGSSDAHYLPLIYMRYQALKQLIQEQQQLEKSQQQQQYYIPLVKPAQESVVIQDELQMLLELNQLKHQELTQEYLHFLRSHPIDPSLSSLSDDFYQDLAVLHQQNAGLQVNDSQPYAIVVLGGGLTQDPNTKQIVVNDYTRLRLETTLSVVHKYPLPIVLSGVEAPYMQAWLAERGVHAQLLEKRSMNTCENTRFSSLLLQKKGGAPRVILVTDRYHMPRTRRLFALNGIYTLPVEAPMPSQLTAWRPSRQNYDHSRRANYELLATLRDILFGSSDCREIP